MRILVTIDAAGPGGHPRDVWVESDPATPFAVLAENLDTADGREFLQAWWDKDRLLEATGSVGSQVFDGSVLSHRPADDPVAGPAVAAGELLAVAGPHAGAAWSLPPGRYLIGRSDDATVNLVGDRTVSRRHAVMDVTPAQVTIRDEGSAHGTTVEGRPVETAILHDGELLRIGSTALAWQTTERPKAVVVADGEGGLVFNRPPRMMASEPLVTVRFGGPAPVRGSVNFPLVATLAPVALGVVMAVALHNPLFLLFTLMGPVIAVSNHFSQRRSGVRSHRERAKAHQETEVRAQHQLDNALREETTRRREASPDPATLAAVAEGPAGGLWERRRGDDDFMRLRVGLGDLPSSVTIEGNPSGGDGSGKQLRQVPAVVDLQTEGVLGIAGERGACEAVATALLVQASVLHAPDDLTLTVLTGPHQGGGWSWTRWLPHIRDKDGRCVARIGSSESSVGRLAGELASLVDERLNRSPLPGSDPPAAHLLVIDGAFHLGSIPAVTKILRRGPQAGIMAICLDDSEKLLPEECRAIALLDPDRPAALTLRTGRGRGHVDVLADMVTPEIAERVARKLAPIRLNRRTAGSATIPASVRLLAEAGLEPPTATAVAEMWRRSDRSTAALIGVCEAGPMVVDLAHDGPHALVAGTTGSGKSELLQTLIASLALVNRPEMMNFVLVDYKGGSAFKECSRLPHTVGMVTDLDGHLTERALASIGAELRRRELILAGIGAKDLEAYWRASGPDDPPLGRLVIVIDEFASLVEELPTFVDGLVDLARRGRSLGIHLVLATQRPSGVVSAAIKTNTNLRIAMRVTDAADSTDVIDSPLAARIQKGLPGRAFVRVGHEDLTEFQAARIGGRRPADGGDTLTALPVSWTTIGEMLSEGSGPAAGEETTDLSLLVAAIAAAAGSTGAPRPRRPWLPALPGSFTLAGPALDPVAGEASLTALFGVEDLPAEQAQQPATFDVTRDGHLLVIGDPGSGRSTLLRSLAASLAARASAEDAHIYGIDCGNGALNALEAFPHVGAVVSRREPDRVDRLVTKLLSETTERQQLLARRGFASIADQRRLSARAERLPYIVVLLDRWEGYNAEFEATDGGRLVSSLMHLMREGHGCGIRLVVTADRSATSPRFSSLADRIVMMRLNDRTVYSVLGLNPRHLPDHMGPGRGFYTRGGTEVQVGLLDDDPSGPAQVAAIDRLARRAVERDAEIPEDRRPDPIAVLPFHASLDLALAAPPSPPSSTAVLVGLGGDRLTSQYVDLARNGPGFVISGPARSGRSNALMAMAASISRNGGKVLAITCRPSPLTSMAGRPGVAAVVDGLTTSPTDLSALLDQVGVERLAVLVDDAEIIADAPLGETLIGFLRAGRDRGAGLVAAGTAGEMGQFRGFIPEVRKSRSGLLLCPATVADGDVVGVRLPRTAVFAGPPGRAVMVVAGAMTLIQVPFYDLT